MTVRVLDYCACLHDDPVFGTQIAVCIVDVLRPALHRLILAPAGTCVSGTQAVQQVQKSVVGLIHFVKVTRSDKFRVSAPHGGVVVVCPASGPTGGITVEHLLLLLVGNSGGFLELVGGGHPAAIAAPGGVVGIHAAAFKRAAH